jgi:hypothetical protein
VFDQGVQIMSHIPNSAIPHAGGVSMMEQDSSGQTAFARRASAITRMAREHPGTTTAAGAMLLAGVAAAAVPLFRKRAVRPKRRSQTPRKKG